MDSSLMHSEPISTLLLPMWQQLVYVGFGAMLWFWVNRIAAFNLYTASTINLPFAALHELAHLSMSVLLFGRVKSLSLVPIKNNNHYVLGSVTIANTNWFNAFPIAFAPLLVIFIPIELFYPWFLFFGDGVPSLIALSFITAAFVQNAIPSKQDLKVALKFPLAFIGYLSIIIALTLH